jgi:thiol-disulfide isomerase/thioredoxin
MKRVIALLFGAALLVTGVTGCGDTGGTPSAGPSGEPSAGPSGAPANAPASSSPAPGKSTPRQLDFEGVTIDGKAFSGSSIAGKPVVFWFWAPWCPTCMAEGPAVAKAAAKHGDKVAFVGVGGLDDSKDRLKRFVSRTDTGGFVHLDDRTGKLYAHFKVTTQSSYLFMTADGKTSKASGPLDESALDRHIDKLIG